MASELRAVKLMDHYLHLNRILAILAGLLILSSIAFGFDLSLDSKLLFSGSIILIILATWIRGRQRRCATRTEQISTNIDARTNEQKDSDWN